VQLMRPACRGKRPQDYRKALFDGSPSQRLCFGSATKGRMSEVAQ
jgi:hypothetical protein